MVGVNPKFQILDCVGRAISLGASRYFQPLRWRWLAVAPLFVPLSFVLVQCGKAPSPGMLAANAQNAGDNFEDRFPKPAFNDRFPSAGESLIQRQVALAPPPRTVRSEPVRVASLTPTLIARKLPSGWLREKLLPAQRQATGYAQTIIPRLEDRPGRSLRSTDDDGHVSISAAGFEDLFAGTGVELEALPFAHAFERELGELAVAAAHATTCGRPLHLHHV